MYELIFWKYLDEHYLNHQEVYELLIENQPIEGLEKLPFDVIVNRIASVFSLWERVDTTSWKDTKSNAAFHVIASAYCVQIHCYGTQGNIMDKLVDILDEYKCPLYDPQIPARYDEMYEEEE
jgi:hypothetical protein